LVGHKYSSVEMWGFLRSPEPAALLHIYVIRLTFALTERLLVCQTPMSASGPEINKLLRRLHQDFDFLLDNNVISTELYDSLVQQIPRSVLSRGPMLTKGYAAAKTTAANIVTPVTPSAASPVSAVAEFNPMEKSPSSPQANKRALLPPPPPPPPPPAYGLAQAEVLYDYSSADEGDLNLIAGQKITVLEYGMFYVSSDI
jgi:hypothetical protein